MKRLDLVGQTFNYLIVIKFSHTKNKKAYWLCRCNRDGNEVISQGTDLKNGSIKSCGCLAIKNRLTHGLSGSRLYRIWENMKKRCSNPNVPNFKDYGGRGIRVCAEWLTFEGFYKDVGESYNKHVEKFGEKNTSIDRYPNVNGNYEVTNYRWATRSEQARGTRKFSQTEDYDSHNYWRHKLGIAISTTLSQHRDSGQRWKKSNIFERYVGITKLEFCNYIESLWEPWMNWNNYGKGIGKWDADHITVCNEFDLSKEEDRKICFNYKNLRPYCSIKNNKEQRRELVTL